MKIQKALYEIMKAECLEAAEKIVIAEMWGDFGTAKAWRAYFDECSIWAIAIKKMSRDEFVVFLSWNVEVREFLGL